MNNHETFFLLQNFSMDMDEWKGAGNFGCSLSAVQQPNSKQNTTLPTKKEKKARKITGLLN